MSNSKDTTDILKNIPLFKGLNNRQIKSVAGGCVSRKFSEGEKMVEQGDGGEGIFIIVSGRAEAIREMANGEKRSVNTFGPHDYFGELALLNEGPRTAAVIARSEVDCLVLTRWDFLALLKKDAEMATAVAQEIARRFRNALDTMF